MAGNSYYSNRKRKDTKKKKKRNIIVASVAGVLVLAIAGIGFFGDNRRKEEVNNAIQENSELKLRVLELEDSVARLQEENDQLRAGATGEPIDLLGGDDGSGDPEPPNDQVTSAVRTAAPKATQTAKSTKTTAPQSKATAKATAKPTAKATAKPTATAKATAKPTAKPTEKATAKPTEKPSDPDKTKVPTKS